MNSLTDLREVVDVVIGVDTHVATHSAAVVNAGTGGVLGEITIEATAEGYAQMVEFAGEHAVLRAWAIEGTGGHGAGLARHLEALEEIVVELDRPKRAQRRNGAKSDPLDAIRAAREALARPRLGTPRSGGDRQALSVLLAARRSAVHAATEAQQQVFSLVIAAPEPIRERFRGQKLPGMLVTAAALRTHASWDVETNTTVARAALVGTALPRVECRGKGARESDPDHYPVLAPRPARRVRCRRHRGRHRAVCLAPAGSTPRPHSQCSPASHQSQPTAAR